jgi:uncharacterized membrane protein (UPF0127 family)
MRINWKQLISIIGVIIIICAGYIYFNNQLDEVKEQMALVSFHNPDDSYFNVTCEIADSDSEHTRGLMFREELPEEEGMLFVYQTPQNVSFWMKNTKIPLDIIFISENRTVLKILEADIQPDVPDSQLVRYRSSGPIKWVVEINQGLSAHNGITNGTLVEIKYID